MTFRPTALPATLLVELYPFPCPQDPNLLPIGVINAPTEGRTTGIDLTGTSRTCSDREWKETGKERRYGSKERTSYGGGGVERNTGVNNNRWAAPSPTGAALGEGNFSGSSGSGDSGGGRVDRSTQLAKPASPLPADATLGGVNVNVSVSVSIGGRAGADADAGGGGSTGRVDRSARVAKLALASPAAPSPGVGSVSGDEHGGCGGGCECGCRGGGDGGRVDRYSRLMESANPSPAALSARRSIASGGGGVGGCGPRSKSCITSARRRARRLPRPETRRLKVSCAVL